MRTAGLRAPRDHAFNYCTARTNLRANGHRCRTSENQFRGRHTIYEGEGSNGMEQSSHFGGSVPKGPKVFSSLSETSKCVIVKYG